jgi:hypothetical protein
MTRTLLFSGGKIMATNAQIEANRQNARKSTGPRTAEGKAAVSQNAIKHGLWGRADVVSWEDPAEFELHREALLAELAPAGAMERMLAARIVGLAWRLQRAQFMQTEAMDSIVAKPAADRKPSMAELLARVRAAHDRKPLPSELSPDSPHWIGAKLTRDWAEDRALDRMLMYERRIESSLYRTMAELQRLRLMRKLEADEGEAAVAPLIGGGFKAAAATSPGTDGLSATSSYGRDARATITPDGVTTNESPLSEGGTPSTRDRSCAKQSQLGEAAGSGEQASGGSNGRGPSYEDCPGVTTGGCAKQSQLDEAAGSYAADLGTDRGVA